MPAPFTGGTYEPFPGDSDARLEAKMALMLYAMATGAVTIQTSGSSAISVADFMPVPTDVQNLHHLRYKRAKLLYAIVSGQVVIHTS